MALPSQDEFSKAMAWQTKGLAKGKAGAGLLEAMGAGKSPGAPKAVSGLLKSIGKRMGTGLGAVTMLALLYYIYKQATKTPQGIPTQTPGTMPATQEAPVGQSFEQRAMGL